jgi:ketosteroid isomerase-like protein
MKLIKHLLHTLFALFMLYTLTRALLHLHEEYYDSPTSYIYSRGNAPEEVRSEIIRQLNMFQDGYTKRDTSLINPFMQQLFNEENVLILGVMPNEICTGQKGVRRLLFGDWNKGKWGDCTFLINNSNISVSGDVAWISTIGYVKSDLSSLLVLPLRLTGVMVKEENVWKFQQMQFQFDLDLTNVLVTIIFMIMWFLVSLVFLIFVVAKSLIKLKNN